MNKEPLKGGEGLTLISNNHSPSSDIIGKSKQNILELLQTSEQIGLVENNIDTIINPPIKGFQVPMIQTMINDLYRLDHKNIRNKAIYNWKDIGISMEKTDNIICDFLSRVYNSRDINLSHKDIKNITNHYLGMKRLYIESLSRDMEEITNR